MDTQTIIAIVAIVLLIAYVIYRNRSTINNNMPQGRERPNYDDPNIQGRGSFGRNRDNTTRNTSSSDLFRKGSPRDNPNVRGKGGFGRDKG